MSIVPPGGSSDAPEIEDGLYLATIKAVKDIKLDKPDQFGNTEKVEIKIEFRDVDGLNQVLDPRVNRKWGEMAALFKIAIACGIDADPDEAFDTEDLVGRRVNVMVETAEEGKWPRVTKWTRAKSKAKVPAGAQEIDPDDLPFN